jgi:hypothetical protein
MSPIHGMTRVMRWTAGGLGLMAVGYATVVGMTGNRYGHIPSASPDERDPLLDQFMPEYEVAERHHVRVAAPAAMTLSAAADTDLQQSTIVRSIFRAHGVSRLTLIENLGGRTLGRISECASS